MIRRAAGVLMGVALLCVVSGCESSESGGLPRALRVRLETEMKAVLQDLRHAQERARAIQDRYLELDELRRTYLSRNVPETYHLEVSDVTESGYRADIVHRSSGLRCQLSVGGADGDGAGTAMPRCE